MEQKHFDFVTRAKKNIDKKMEDLQAIIDDISPEYDVQSGVNELYAADAISKTVELKTELELFARVLDKLAREPSRKAS